MHFVRLKANQADQLIELLFRFFVYLFISAGFIIAAYYMFDQAGILPTQSKVSVIQNVQDFPIGGVQGENILTQTFKTDRDITRIGVKVATYDRENPGEVYFRVYDRETNTTFSTHAILANKFSDNQYYEVALEQILPASDHVYALEISGTTPNPNDSIGVWSSVINSYDDGVLLMGDYETEADILFYLVSTQNNSIVMPIIMATLMAIIIVALISAYVIWVNKSNNKVSA